MTTDMKEFNSVFPHLRAEHGDAGLIGRKVRYCGNGCEAYGAIQRTGVFEIVGHQVDWRGSDCYRVKCIEFNGKPYNDRFGYVMNPDECAFVVEAVQ